MNAPYVSRDIYTYTRLHVCIVPRSHSRATSFSLAFFPLFFIISQNYLHDYRLDFFLTSLPFPSLLAFLIPLSL
ncbi:hypothetical protein F5Y14DRAFT_412760 [Nemania sp. NC0429]|nr:hypothetical protein F5Y14DRAFT_412760 [Nemania sp. NC0429]